MTGKTGGHGRSIYDELRLGCMQNLLGLHLHVFPKCDVFFSKFKVYNRNGDAVGISSRRVNRHAAIGASQNLTETAHLEKPWLYITDLSFKLYTESWQVLRVIRIAKPGKLILILKAPNICILAVHIEARDISMIQGAVIVYWWCANQVF